MNLEEILPTKLSEPLRTRWSDYVLHITGCENATDLANQLSGGETTKSFRVQCSRFVNGEGREIANWLKRGSASGAKFEGLGKLSVAEVANWLVSRLPSSMGDAAILIQFLQPSLQVDKQAPERISELIERVRKSTDKEIVLWPDGPNNNLDLLLERSVVGTSVRVEHNRFNRPWAENGPNIPVKVSLTRRDLEDWLGKLKSISLLSEDLDGLLQAVWSIRDEDLAHLAQAPSDVFKSALLTILKGDTSAVRIHAVEQRTLELHRETMLEVANASVKAFVEVKLVSFLELWFSKVGDLHGTCSSTQLDECLGESEKYEAETLLSASLSALLRDDPEDRQAAVGRILASMHRDVRRELLDAGFLQAVEDGQFRLSLDLIRLAELELKLHLTLDQFALLPETVVPKDFVYTDYRDIIFGAVIQSELGVEEWIAAALEEQNLSYARAIFDGLTMRDSAEFSQELKTQIIRLWASLAWVISTEPRDWLYHSLGETLFHLFPEIDSPEVLERLVDRNFVEIYAANRTPEMSAIRDVIPFHCPFEYTNEEFETKGHPLRILLHRLKLQDKGAQAFLLKNPKYFGAFRDLSDLEFLEILAQIPAEQWRLADEHSVHHLKRRLLELRTDIADHTLAALYFNVPKAFDWMEKLSDRDTFWLLSWLNFEAEQDPLIEFAVQVLRAANDHETLEWIIDAAEDSSYASEFQREFRFSEQEGVMERLAQLRHGALLALATMGKPKLLAERTHTWTSRWPQELMIAKCAIERLWWLRDETDEVIKRELCALYLHAFLHSQLAEALSEKLFENSTIEELIIGLSTPDGKDGSVGWVPHVAPTIYEKARRFAKPWQENPALSQERADISRTQYS